MPTQRWTAALVSLLILNLGCSVATELSRAELYCCTCGYSVKCRLGSEMEHTLLMSLPDCFRFEQTEGCNILQNRTDGNTAGRQSHEHTHTHEGFEKDFDGIDCRIAYNLKHGYLNAPGTDCYAKAVELTRDSIKSGVASQLQCETLGRDKSRDKDRFRARPADEHICSHLDGVQRIAGPAECCVCSVDTTCTYDYPHAAGWSRIKTMAEADCFGFEFNSILQRCDADGCRLAAERRLPLDEQRCMQQLQECGRARIQARMDNEFECLPDNPPACDECGGWRAVSSPRISDEKTSGSCDSHPSSTIPPNARGEHLGCFTVSEKKGSRVVCVSNPVLSMASQFRRPTVHGLSHTLLAAIASVNLAVLITHAG